jgi:hypothetical protein
MIYDVLDAKHLCIHDCVSPISDLSTHDAAGLTSRAFTPKLIELSSSLMYEPYTTLCAACGGHPQPAVFVVLQAGVQDQWRSRAGEYLTFRQLLVDQETLYRQLCSLRCFTAISSLSSVLFLPSPSRIQVTNSIGQLN